jgi:hypothetical protein
MRVFNNVISTFQFIHSIPVFHRLFNLEISQFMEVTSTPSTFDLLTNYRANISELIIRLIRTQLLLLLLCQS